MRIVGVALFLACLLSPLIAAAQNTAEIADTMVRLCVGGGHTEATSGIGSGGADLSLRSLDVKGNLKGEFKISKSNAEGPVDGLNNALSQVAADQADKVRVCLQPVRDRLLDVMLPAQKQGSTGQTVTAPGGVAVGGNVNNSPITLHLPRNRRGNDRLITLGRGSRRGTRSVWAAVLGSVVTAVIVVQPCAGQQNVTAPGGVAVGGNLENSPIKIINQQDPAVLAAMAKTFADQMAATTETRAKAEAKAADLSFQPTVPAAKPRGKGPRGNL